MIRRCKDVDICSTQHIREAVLACLKPAKKRRRYDTVGLFSKLLGVSKRAASRSLASKDAQYYSGVELIVVRMQECLKSGDLQLRKPSIKERIDPCSRKVRKVAVLHIWNLLFDHVATLGLAELCKSIGEYQVSSIPGRGAAYGDRAIRKWLRRDTGKKLYWAKLDVRNFYGSVDQGLLLEWLAKRVANKNLMYLISSLVRVLDTGLAIGSYLSQTLANLYLSTLYHYASERCTYSRRNKRVRVFSHVLFYMDDMTFLGHNRRQMRKHLTAIVAKASTSLGLEIKPNWVLQEFSQRYPLDIMGFRYTPGKVSLRRRIYKYARRMLIRCGRKRPSRKAANRLTSYNGYLTATCSLPKIGNWRTIIETSCSVAGGH